MKVLQIHNYYQSPGGEDQVVAAECHLLRSRGHEVVQYLAHNDDIREMSGFEVGVKTLWNTNTYQDVRELIRREQPDVAHAHNTFPLISPALYYAVAAEQIPIVQTLHNYRLLCPGGSLFRDNRICEECVRAPVPYRAALHKCYRDDRAASAAVAAMLTGHRVLGTWKNRIDRYIAITRFSKEKFVEGGLPPEKITVKPNFLAKDPEVGTGNGKFALFLGRLSEEKGLDVLLDAWRKLGSLIDLRIAGDGPLHSWVSEQASSLPSVEVLGFCDRDAVMSLLKEATFVVLPSTCYEHLSMVFIEALGCGTPVIASALGTMNEAVVDGVNGYRFKAGDSADLSGCIEDILRRPSELRAMRKTARATYEENYTAEQNYALLMDIYASVVPKSLEELMSRIEVADPRRR